MIKLNVHGEVADFQDASQFEPNESEFAGHPGRGATGTQEEVDQVADAFYTKYIGPNVESDTQGTSIEIMHQIKGWRVTLPRYMSQQCQQPIELRYCSYWGVSIIGTEMDGKL